MNIGLLGTGAMATAVGRRFAACDHRIRFGSHCPERAVEVARHIGHGASGGTYASAATFGDIVVLATDWSRAPAALAEYAPLAGKALLDCSNPKAADGRSLAIGFATSGAEEIARRAPGALVVKGLNHVYCHVLDAIDGIRPAPTAFLCSDHPSALHATGELLRGAGLDPIQAGPLSHARYLEPLAMLLRHLAETHTLEPVDTGILFARDYRGLA